MKIQDIRHVGLLSPAIAPHGRFYLEGWGLQSAGEDRHARYFRGSSAEHHILSLHPADRCGLHHLAFSVDGREAGDAAVERKASLARVTGPEPCQVKSKARLRRSRAKRLRRRGCRPVQ